MTKTKEWFKTTAFKMSWEEYQLCDCDQCKEEDRRFPKVDGGLGLCPKLKSN